MSNFAAWPCNCRIPWLDSRFRVIFVGILIFLASAHPSIPRGMRMNNFAVWPCNCGLPRVDSRFRVIFVGMLNSLASAHPSIPRGMPRKCD